MEIRCRSLDGCFFFLIRWDHPQIFFR